MTDPDEAAPVLALEPEDLDGHTLEELSEYLEHDREPADPSIDNSPACQIALGALQRLNALASRYLDEDDPSLGSDQDWIGRALTALSLDARAGRKFPFPQTHPDTSAHVTEGALRGLVRMLGDSADGLIVGGVVLDLDRDDRSVDLRVDVALVYGNVVDEVVRAFRTALQEGLPKQAPMSLRRLDVRIVDVVDLRSSHGRGGRAR